MKILPALLRAAALSLLALPAASLPQDCCWMWTARDKTAKLDGKIGAGSQAGTNFSAAPLLQ